jgi:hypothetical protein
MYWDLNVPYPGNKQQAAAIANMAIQRKKTTKGRTATARKHECKN